MSLPKFDIERYKEVPFEERGRTIQGADCYGIVIISFREQLGIDLNEHEYITTKDGKKLEELCRIESEKEIWEKIELGQERNWDLLNLRIFGSASHVGIVLDSRRGDFVHSLDGVGVCIENYKRSPLWRRPGIIRGVYRHERLA